LLEASIWPVQSSTPYLHQENYSGGQSCRTGKCFVLTLIQELPQRICLLALAPAATLINYDEYNFNRFKFILSLQNVYRASHGK